MVLVIVQTFRVSTFIFSIESFYHMFYHGCCFFTLELSSKIWSPRSHKGAGALGTSEKQNELKIRPGNTTLPRKKKTHNTEKGAQVKRFNVQLNSHGRGYPLNYSIEFPRSHNSPTRGYELQRLGCLHCTNRTVTVSIDERACRLECCHSNDPRACS